MEEIKSKCWSADTENGDTYCHTSDRNNAMTTLLQRMEQNADSFEPVMGEVVLSGVQANDVSSYRNLPELTTCTFVHQYCEDMWMKNQGNGHVNNQKKVSNRIDKFIII